MSNQTPLIKDAYDKLVLARDALQCVIDNSKCTTSNPNFTDAIKTAAQKQFALDHFGPQAVQATNRSEASTRLDTAQSNLLNQVEAIAKQYNSTCRQCNALSDWHLVRAAVFFVNRTQDFKEANRVGYASTVKDPATGTVTPQNYQGRFATSISGDAYSIDSLKEEALQDPDVRSFVLEGMRENVYKIARQINDSESQEDIKATAITLQGQLVTLASYLKTETSWWVPETASDKERALTLGAIDKDRISKDTKGPKKCVGASYVMPDEALDNSKPSDPATRGKFVTFALRFAPTAIVSGTAR